MVATITVSSRDSIRVTINIRNTNIIIIISIFSIIISIIVENKVIIKVFNYIATAAILIFAMVVIATLINVMKFRVIYSGSYTFTFRRHILFSSFLSQENYFTIQ